MRNLEKYKGVIPAFYACYDKEGNVSPEGVQALTRYFVEKGVKGADRSLLLFQILSGCLPAYIPDPSL